MSSSPAENLRALRAGMAARGLDACAVFTADPHLSEYLPAHWQGREWLSGFGGSAGTLVVTKDAAGLWTDSRYWEQAAGQLGGSGIDLMRAGEADVPSPAHWLAGRLPRGAAVSVDGHCMAMQAHRQWQETLSPAGIRLATDHDLLQDIWAGRPGLPHEPVYEHLPPHATRTRAANLAAVRAVMAEQGAQWHWLSSLDDIAWLFNLRGSDVPHNPVFLSFALIGADSATLFVEPGKIPEALAARLLADGVEVQPYDAALGALSCLPESDKLLLDPARVTVGTLAAAAFVGKVEALNPSQRLKARKNDEEAAHVRRAMEQDGAALCEFFAWFEAAQKQGGITEITVDEKICAARARRPGFVTTSFGTIAAYNANGAMPHYHATEASHASVEGDGLLLIDSGGQYLGGTTDITRVVTVGQPSVEQKRDFTIVLQGMIALSQAVFPRGIQASLLDTLARAPIWRSGAEFGHGTGHGVGYFLNVHEGPQSISYRARQTPDSIMDTGMITSNEPGLYRPGKWGIRIENLVLAVPACKTEFGEFLKFETLTLCPIDTRCILADMLSASERDWLNDYHREVRERLAPLVDGAALQWLNVRTEPV